MSLKPTGLPSAPSIRGTLNPHTSASSTPTERPAFARAAARFTVTLDLPTPPFPEAIAMIEVCGGNEIVVSGAAGAPPRSPETSFSRSSVLIGVSSTSTRSTPSSGWTAAVTSLVIRSLSGHPSMVRRTWTRTTPPSTSTDFSMPISSIGLPISGSSTPFSASRTCASVATGSSQLLWPSFCWLSGSKLWLTRCEPCKAHRTRCVDERTRPDRDPQGPGGRHPLPALSLPAPVRAAGPRPRARHAAEPPRQHDPSAPSAAGGCGPRRVGDATRPVGGRAPANGLHGGGDGQPRGPRPPVARRHPRHAHQRAAGPHGRREPRSRVG